MGAVGTCRHSREVSGDRHQLGEARPMIKIPRPCLLVSILRRRPALALFALGRSLASSLLACQGRAILVICENLAWRELYGRHPGSLEADTKPNIVRKEEPLTTATTNCAAICLDFSAEPYEPNSALPTEYEQRKPYTVRRMRLSGRGLKFRCLRLLFRFGSSRDLEFWF
jgi:hypothetical protein